MLGVILSAPGKAYEGWGCPVFECETVESAVDAGLCTDGIFRIGRGASSFDVMLTNSEALADAADRIVLVCFNAAVNDRKGKAVPFFSGKGVAQVLGLPLLSVDDPTLALNDDLCLAWYAGNEGLPGLTNLIADYLDRFSEKNRCRLVLFGGSGGGFAAISILEHLDVSATALVWNPQTDISKYRPDFVATYLSSAFPSLNMSGVESLSPDAAQAVLAQQLTKAGVNFDITDWSAPGTSRLLYLQNFDDWHVPAHAAPFMSGGNWMRLGKRSFYSADRGVASWFGSWGKGHVAPPQDLLCSALSALCAGEEVMDVAARLDRESISQYGSLPWFKADGAPALAHVSAQRKGGLVEVSASLEWDAQQFGDVEYAYYVHRDWARVAVQWYSPSPSAAIECPPGKGTETVKVFVRDAFGGTVTANAAITLVI